MIQGSHVLRVALVSVFVVLLFWLYAKGLSKNPPGFYVDECGIAYNAYLLGHTGTGQFGGRFPLFFQFYTDGYTQWANPTQIYLLAIPFRIFRPSILLARVYAAFWVFAACWLLGFLAARISGRRIIGIIVVAIALCTPWLFEVSRLVFETYFYPMAVVLFLFAVYRTQQRDRWSWSDIAFVAFALALLTYSYTIGRLLGPLMAIGLLFFVSTVERWFSVLKTWLLYAISLVPLIVFRFRHSGALTQRFYSVSYITPDTPWREIASGFIRRYLEDLSLVSLLLDGDANPRHHVPGSLGSFLLGVFVLAMIGLIIILVRHSDSAWWRFIVFGTIISIVPGSLTLDQFHSLRMLAYPVFLIVLTIPALLFLLGAPSDNQAQVGISWRGLPATTRQAILTVLLMAAAWQTVYFQSVFRRDGPGRGGWFDADYQAVYDTALAQPQRPIYAIDGDYGPMDACTYWYATLERRELSEFVHLSFGAHAPAGTIVISTEDYCVNCEVIDRRGYYLAYRQF